VFDGAEEITDVGLHDPCPAPDEPGAELLFRLGRRPLGPEPKRGVAEVGLEDRFEHDLRRLLHHPVADRRNTQRPFAAVGLRDLHAPGWRGAISALSQVTSDFVEQPLDPVVLHLLQRLPVNPGSASIGPDSLPRLHQDVTPVDSVEQGVETPLRRLLGRSP
jgi:hypothetical protein